MKDWKTPLDEAKDELEQAETALNRGAMKAFAGRIADAKVILDNLLEEIEESSD